MCTLHFRQTTTVTPEQFIAGLTDFGPGRSKLFPNSADGYLEVHNKGAGHADVTEGSAGIWERLRYDWPEKLSPFVTVGRVHVPRQDFSGTEHLEKTDALAFNQWRVIEEHRPLGEIMQVRPIYSASARVRRTLNHQPQTEPASADEVLPYPVAPSSTRPMAPPYPQTSEPAP